MDCFSKDANYNRYRWTARNIPPPLDATWERDQPREWALLAIAFPFHFNATFTQLDYASKQVILNASGPSSNIPILYPHRLGPPSADSRRICTVPSTEGSQHCATAYSAFFSRYTALDCDASKSRWKAHLRSRYRKALTQIQCHAQKSSTHIHRQCNRAKEAALSAGHKSFERNQTIPEVHRPAHIKVTVFAPRARDCTEQRPRKSYNEMAKPCNNGATRGGGGFFGALV